MENNLSPIQGRKEGKMGYKFGDIVELEFIGERASEERQLRYFVSETSDQWFLCTVSTGYHTENWQKQYVKIRRIK